MITNRIFSLWVYWYILVSFVYYLINLEILQYINQIIKIEKFLYYKESKFGFLYVIWELLVCSSEVNMNMVYSFSCNV